MIWILFIFQSFSVDLWQLFSLAETILESSILEHILFCLFYRAHLVIESINLISFLKVWRTLNKIIFAWRESVSYAKLWWLWLEAVRSPGWCMFIVCYFIFVEGRGHLVYLVIELIARVSFFVIFTITDLWLKLESYPPPPITNINWMWLVSVIHPIEAYGIAFPDQFRYAEYDSEAYQWNIA